MGMITIGQDFFVERFVKTLSTLVQWATLQHGEGKKLIAEGEIRPSIRSIKAANRARSVLPSQSHMRWFRVAQKLPLPKTGSEEPWELKNSINKNSHNYAFLYSICISISAWNLAHILSHKKWKVLSIEPLIMPVQDSHRQDPLSQIDHYYLKLLRRIFHRC